MQSLWFDRGRRIRELASLSDLTSKARRKRVAINYDSVIFFKNSRRIGSKFFNLYNTPTTKKNKINDRFSYVYVKSRFAKGNSLFDRFEGKQNKSDPIKVKSQDAEEGIKSIVERILSLRLFHLFQQVFISKIRDKSFDLVLGPSDSRTIIYMVEEILKDFQFFGRQTIYWSEKPPTSSTDRGSTSLLPLFKYDSIRDQEVNRVTRSTLGWAQGPRFSALLAPRWIIEFSGNIYIYIYIPIRRRNETCLCLVSTRLLKWKREKRRGRRKEEKEKRKRGKIAQNLVQKFIKR